MAAVAVASGLVGAIVGVAAKQRKQCTLILVLEAGRMLLGMKKRGFGVGKYNGFGGKVEPGETIHAGALVRACAPSEG